MFKFLMLAVYILVNAYIMWRGALWLHHIMTRLEWKRKKLPITILAIAYAACASTMIIWIIFPKNGPLAESVHRFGNIWYGTLAVLLAFLLIADLLLFIIKKMHKRSLISATLPRRYYLVSGVLVICLTAGFSLYGCFNTSKIITTKYDVTVHKQVPKLNDLNICLVSDMHLGYSVGCAQMEKMVSKINETNPDLVVFAGDIYDNDFDTVENPKKMEQIFRSIKSKYGVYAVYGNHDIQNLLVGGFVVDEKENRDPRMEKLLTDSNIHVMKDQTTLIDGGKFYLVGRLDGERPGGDGSRKTLEELTDTLNHEKPIFVINHEPDELQENADCGVDLLLSGHTHNGQLFPLTLTRHLKWKNPAGCRKVDNMYSLVTQGVGVYGPNMRTFSHAEVMSIHVRFAK